MYSLRKWLKCVNDCRACDSRLIISVVSRVKPLFWPALNCYAFKIIVNIFLYLIMTITFVYQNVIISSMKNIYKYKIAKSTLISLFDIRKNESFWISHIYQCFINSFNFHTKRNNEKIFLLNAKCFKSRKSFIVN